MSEGDYTKSYKLSPELEIAPVRSLDDFLLSSARFQVPQFNDSNKWTNRVLCNLLYYQTNYFILMAAIFFLMSLTNPRDVILGTICISAALGLFFFVTTTIPEVLAFKKDHPLISLGLILLGGYICVFMFSSVMIFIFSVAFPMMIAFIHASMRLRNMKNKIANKAEAAGVTKTVMGRFFDILGLKTEVIRFD